VDLIWRPDPARQPARVAVLAAGFNPITRAHIALLEAARPFADELLCVLPRVYPHKGWEETTFEQRLELLRAAAAPAGYSIAISNGGLFAEIAAEARSALQAAEVAILCGRDAAERMLTWDYGRNGAVEEMLKSFRLLVADRAGRFEPPAELATRIQKLVLPEPLDHVSSTEVRERARRGEPWRHLVPELAADLVARLYSQTNPLPQAACHNSSDESR
jgi:nicotinic acid mononucleotide adenylyltransferase